MAVHWRTSHHQPLNAQQSEKGAFIMPKHTYTKADVEALAAIASRYGFSGTAYATFLDSADDTPPEDVNNEWNRLAKQFNSYKAGHQFDLALGTYQQLVALKSEWPKFFDKAGVLEEAGQRIKDLLEIKDIINR